MMMKQGIYDYQQLLLTAMLVVLVSFLSLILGTIKDSHTQLLSPQLPIFIPSINDPALKVEPVITGLNSTSSIAFLGPDDMLVLERNTGIVWRVVNGQKLDEPLLEVNVSPYYENGLLGIDTAKDSNNTTYVFIYYTQGEPKDPFAEDKEMGNKLYRYKLLNNKLVDPKLLLSLPKFWFHNGGAISIGPDNYLYIPVGDFFTSKTMAQNIRNGSDLNLSGGILRMTQEGKPVQGIIGHSFPELLYFAYGIRNSFGIDFDPVTGNLWDTENGPTFGDEINLVKPGFNSGWSQVQGKWQAKESSGAFQTRGEIFKDFENLVSFDPGVTKYDSPKFSWLIPVGPTAIQFLSSDKLGIKYKNDIIVGDIVNGRLYHFELNKTRTGLELDGPLSDEVANEFTELEPLIFGQDFGGITDVEVSPDGYLYVVSSGGIMYDSFINSVLPGYKEGTIYKVTPLDASKSYNRSNNMHPNLNSDILYNMNTIGFNKTSSTNETVTLNGNNTVWSDPLQKNATYIEGSFRLMNVKNKTDDRHAGLTWKDGENTTYYVFVRPGPSLAISSSVSGEIGGTILLQNSSDWNKLKIINTKDDIYVYHNDLLKIKILRDSRDAYISQVGIGSYNAIAEFGPINIGWASQNLSQLLLPNETVTLNGNNTVWSKPLQKNATYIEGKFRLMDGENKTDDRHAGIVWKEGDESKSYYAFIRPDGRLSLATPLGQELVSTSKVSGRGGEWYTLKVVDVNGKVNVILNNLLQIVSPKTLSDVSVDADANTNANISKVGIRTYNSNAEFEPINIGWASQNLSGLLLPKNP
jgi:glucose/arabinose dehydrogenase